MGPAVSDLESLTSKLDVSLGDIGIGRWRIYKNIELGLRDQIAKLGGTEDEVNEVKEIVIGSDPLLLAISMLVSLLHMLFEVNGVYVHEWCGYSVESCTARLCFPHMVPAETDQYAEAICRSRSTTSLE